METYELQDGERAIRCLLCGQVSWRACDVARRYCRVCGVFHGCEGDRGRGMLMVCLNCQTTQLEDRRVDADWYILRLASWSPGAWRADVRHICPACLGMATPRCAKCQRFFSGKYQSCPWCYLAAA